MKSGVIEERLFTLAEFKSAHIVMFFASIRSEVQTETMIRRALAAGKRVVLPKVKGKELVFFEITDFNTDVVRGTWGIPEPIESRPADLSNIDLIVMPGTAFDELGNRIGYGAGYYDKFLPTYGKSTVALAFELQIIASVPVDQHDVPVKKIITEKRVIETKPSPRGSMK